MLGQLSSSVFIKKAIAVSLLMLFLGFTAACTTKKLMATEERRAIELAQIFASTEIFDTTICYHGSPIHTDEVSCVGATHPIPVRSSPDTIVRHRRTAVQIEAVDSSQSVTHVEKSKETHASTRQTRSEWPLWKIATIVIVLIFLIPAITQVFRRFY